jgi:hypothetical protein
MKFRLRRCRAGLMVVPALVCSLGLAACGGGFDSSASGEHLIKDYVKKFGRGSVAVKSIKCPGGVKETVGGSYNCQVVLRDTTTGTDHSGTITIHMAKGNKVEINGSTDIHVQ